MKPVSQVQPAPITPRDWRYLSCQKTLQGESRYACNTCTFKSCPAMQRMGCNQLLCADPHTRETRRFLTGPRGCEITGITMPPDCRTLWINVQDPDLHYPASDGKTRPRSTTVVITKNDGGVIGS